MKIAYAAGAGLREIARKMNIPEGTVLAHAQRKGWTNGRFEAAKQKGSRGRSERCYRSDGGCSGELTGGIRLVMIRGWMKAFAG